MVFLVILGLLKIVKMSPTLPLGQCGDGVPTLPLGECVELLLKAQNRQKLIILGLLKFVQNSPTLPLGECGDGVPTLPLGECGEGSGASGKTGISALEELQALSLGDQQINSWITPRLENVDQKNMCFWVWGL